MFDETESSREGAPHALDRLCRWLLAAAAGLRPAAAGCSPCLHTLLVLPAHACKPDHRPLPTMPLQVLLMTLPAELISWKAPERAELNLQTTFSDLSAQGWLSLVFIAGGFLLMVFDLVGGGQGLRGSCSAMSPSAAPQLPPSTAPAHSLAVPRRLCCPAPWAP